MQHETEIPNNTPRVKDPVAGIACANCDSHNTVLIPGKPDKNVCNDCKYEEPRQ